MEEKQYSPINTEEIVIERVDDDDTRRNSTRNPEFPITLWCFRVLFTAAVVIVWCFSLHISTGLFKDFLFHCTSYDCAYLDDLIGGTTSKVNDTFCSLNTTLWDHDDFLYFPTRCTLEINDLGGTMITLTWFMPFFGILLSGEEPSEILWRRVCFIVELIINFLIVWNGVYILLFIDAVLLLVWFDMTPFMCGKYPVR